MRDAVFRTAAKERRIRCASMKGVETCPAYLEELRDVTNAADGPTPRTVRGGGEVVGMRDANMWRTWRAGVDFRDKLCAAGRVCERLRERSFCALDRFLRRMKVGEKLANGLDSDGFGGYFRGALVASGRACEKLRKKLVGATSRVLKNARGRARFAEGFHRRGTGDGGGRSGSGGGGRGGVDGGGVCGGGGGGGRNRGGNIRGSRNSVRGGGGNISCNASSSASSNGSSADINGSSSSGTSGSDSGCGNISGSSRSRCSSDSSSTDINHRSGRSITSGIDDDDDDVDCAGGGSSGGGSNDDRNQNPTNDLNTLAHVVRNRQHQHGNPEQYRIVAAQRALERVPLRNMSLRSLTCAGGYWALMWTIVCLGFYRKKARSIFVQVTRGSAREGANLGGKRNSSANSSVRVRGKG